MKKILVLLAVTTILSVNFAIAADCDHKNDSGRAPKADTSKPATGSETSDTATEGQ